MSKTKMTAMLVLVGIVVCTLSILPGCKEPEETTVTETATETVEEANGETVEEAIEEEVVETESQEKILIGVSLSATDPFMMQTLVRIQETAIENGAEIIYTNAENKIPKQIADVEALIAKECDAIIIRAIDPEGLAPAADQCAAAGIPLLDIGNGINSDGLTLSVKLGQYAGGVIIGEYLTKTLEENPDLTLNVGYIWGWKGIPIVDERYNSIFDTLKPMMDEGRVNILDEQICEWDIPRSMNVTENWLQKFPEMNSVIAMGDQMALGACNVLKSTNADFSKWYVVGFDLRELVDSLVAGEAFSSVYMNVDLFAQTAAEEAIKLANGEIPETKVMDLTETGLAIWQLVNRDNIGDFVAPK